MLKISAVRTSYSNCVTHEAVVNNGARGKSNVHRSIEIMVGDSLSGFEVESIRIWLVSILKIEIHTAFITSADGQ